MSNLLPIEHIQFDPVTRQIVKPKPKLNYELLFKYKSPQFYDTGHFYTPYLPSVLIPFVCKY